MLFVCFISFVLFMWARLFESGKRFTTGQGEYSQVILTSFKSANAVFVFRTGFSRSLLDHVNHVWFFE